MRKRIEISKLHEYIGKEVIVAGFVDVRRDHGKLIFIDLRDRSARVQIVALPTHTAARDIADMLRPEWTISVRGTVKKRPDSLVNKNEALGNIEVEASDIAVLGRAHELPFEKEETVNLDTYLDYLPLTLRSKRSRAIFAVQAALIQSFRTFLAGEGFTEFQTPKIIGEDAEGGADSFSVAYFKHRAHLAQSPQLYKQIMVGVFERVFTTGNVYRAEKHSTTRHLNEYTSLDIEMGFITDHTDVMRLETELLSAMFKEIAKRRAEDLAFLGAEVPKVPKEIPSLTLREAQAIIKTETGADKLREPDLEPEDERWLCEYAKREYDSDLIFVTHFPTSKRPFYTYRDEANPAYTKGFDLLFRGVEITTGAQRIHEYDALVASMKEKGLNPEKFSFYLQAFKYGMPPHGGFGMGLERLTQKLLGLANVKEATLFPREINRIDTLLSR